MYAYIQRTYNMRRPLPDGAPSTAGRRAPNTDTDTIVNMQSMPTCIISKSIHQPPESLLSFRLLRRQQKHGPETMLSSKRKLSAPSQPWPSPASAECQIGACPAAIPRPSRCSSNPSP